MNFSTELVPLYTLDIRLYINIIIYGASRSLDPDDIYTVLSSKEGPTEASTCTKSGPREGMPSYQNDGSPTLADERDTPD